MTQPAAPEPKYLPTDEEMKEAHDGVEPWCDREAEWEHWLSVHDAKVRDRALEASAAELERTKLGARELGRLVERFGREMLEATGRTDLVNDDGDGDWQLVSELLAELRPRAEAAEQALADERAKRSDLPCDRGCNVNDGPMEDCSQHGRSPRDLWGIIEGLNQRLAAERAERPDREQIARAIYSGRRSAVPWEMVAPDMEDLHLAMADAVLSSLALEPEAGEVYQYAVVEAAARAINPKAWEMFDRAVAADPENASNLSLVEHTLLAARAALEAVREVSRG